MKSLRIGITGSPGTGKKTVGKVLAQITGSELVSLNELAIRNGIGWHDGKEFVINIGKLRHMKIETSGRIVIGHLLPLIIPKPNIDFVAILRCSPEELRKRYIARGYGTNKTTENLEAELLDLVSFAALKQYGRKKVGEFDTSKTRNSKAVARLILRTVQGKRPKEYGITKWSESASKSASSLLRILRS